MPRHKVVSVVLSTLFRRTNTTFIRDTSLSLSLKGSGEIRIDSFSDLYIFWEIFIDRCYDVDINPPPSVIVDVGANVGLFALRMKQLYQEARVWCFEPLQSNTERLKRNIASSGVTGITIHRLGVSDLRAEVPIFIHPSNTGGHTLIKSVAHPQASTQLITVIPISDVFEIIGTERIDLLKLDCEGAEKQIILNLTKDDAKSIGTIIYEPTPSYYDPNVLRRHLENFGYQYSLEKGLAVARQ